MSDIDTAVTADSAPAEANEFVDGFYDESDDSQGTSQEEVTEEAAEEATTEDTTENSEGEDSTESTSNQADWDSLSGKSQERFQQIANEKRELQRQLEELQAQQAQFANEQELLDTINPETGDYYSPGEVARMGYYQRLQAQQEQVQQQSYELQVRQNQNAILSEGERALQEFPEFDSSSDKFDPELSSRVDAILEANTIFDDNGRIVGMRQSPYEILKAFVDTRNSVAQKERTIGQANAQRATEKMLANVDPSGSTSGANQVDENDFIDNFFD